MTEDLIERGCVMMIAFLIALLTLCLLVDPPHG